MEIYVCTYTTHPSHLDMVTTWIEGRNDRKMYVRMLHFSVYLSQNTVEYTGVIVLNA